MYCKNCGKEIRDDSQFCWNCGFKIEIKKEDIQIAEDITRKISCKNCGEEIYEKADVCSHCGIRLRVAAVKNPGVAAVLSFFAPGLGQIYNGEIVIGIAFLIIDILLAVVGISLIRTLKVIEGIAFLVIAFIFWTFNIYNAYKISEKVNQRQY